MEKDTKIAFGFSDEGMEFLYYAKRKLKAKDFAEVIAYALVALRQTFKNEEKDREGN